ncbi:hypothetical protein IE53DRAFT_336028 [Violaceomyces palustris]|uniref:Uncharacterized protein n=1 Tax=Violaceomyces palustris TaxID=1673888 RepID=A0ACD0NMM8_9BASI|nr:hypothetical protein IE53DRAFT_336028 [Violaceomyces palustris]
MPLAHPTIEWSSLQDFFYRKSEIYTLSWGIENLADYVVASASNAGLLALVRDPTRLVSLGKASLLKPKILVYTSAGQLVDSIPWDPSNRIVGLGFNSLEQLVVVLEEGQVRIYTLFSPCPAPSSSGQPSDPSSSSEVLPEPIEATSNAYYNQYSLGPDATETGVIEAKIWGEGLVALVGGRRFVEWRFPGLDQDGGPNMSDGDGGSNASNPNLPNGEFGYTFAGMEGGSRPLPKPRVFPPADPIPPLVSGQFGLSSALPSAWAVIPPKISQTGETAVLIARDETLLSLSHSSSGSSSSSISCHDMKLSRGPFHSINLSPNGKLLALLTDDMVLWVVRTDLTDSLSEFDIKQSGAFQDATRAEASFSSSAIASGAADQGKGGLGGTGIRSIQWCGNDTVALAFNDEVVMVGPFGNSIRYPYSGPVHLIGEVDGLRVISSDMHEFIQKVPDASNQVFRPGSAHAAAILFDSSEQFTKKSSKADEGVRAIRGDLASAVDTCLRAAAYEWDLVWQRKLIRAASFGKSFIDLYDPTPFVKTARTLRVLNAARAYEIGIPISYDQYALAGPTALLSRLTAQNHHLLSLRIASYLRIRPDPILKHWARAKIARSRPPIGSAAAIAMAEERVCDEIVAKFKLASGISDQGDESRGGGGPSTGVNFSEVAWTAWKAGRRGLATKLLDHEARAIDQVPLLLNMREDKLALVKAIESGDTDLIYHVLLRLKSQLSRGDFFRIVQAPVSDALAPGATAADANELSRAYATQHLSLASNLLEVYAREQDRELLRDFYYQDDRRTESALLALSEAREAGGDDGLAEKIFKMKEAMKLFSEDKERVLEAKLVEEQIKLLAFQQALEKEDGGRTKLTGLSLNETMRQCLMRNMAKKAEKLRSDFKVPEKRFWNVKIDALVQARDFEALWAFSGGGMGGRKAHVAPAPFLK